MLFTEPAHGSDFPTERRCKLLRTHNASGPAGRLLPTSPDAADAHQPTLAHTAGQTGRSAQRWLPGHAGQRRGERCPASRTAAGQTPGQLQTHHRSTANRSAESHKYEIMMLAHNVVFPLKESLLLTYVVLYDITSSDIQSQLFAVYSVQHLFQ